jgi:4-amino-4-deoxy-L-arabinose transferase-like glycosyltransferase
MSPSPPRRFVSQLTSIGRDRKRLALLLTMLGILALGAYLRLWNICHLFNVVHDYDEGAWSLAARFISQGYLPYRDFVLVHPPFYEFVLAAVYKVFGYSFFYGRYLSIALSLACIILIYFIGRKMYHPVAGIAAAALFAVSTEMVYFGRRSVQETLGIFLILLAIYFAFDFIENRKQNRLLWCGLVLGLAVATKYVFIPAVIAIIVTVIMLSMGERFWKSIKKLGEPMLWVIYGSFAAIFYAFLLLLRWVFGLDVAIPFIDPMYLTAGNVMTVILVFVVPFFIALMLKKSFPSKNWWLQLWSLRRNKALWMLIGGTALGFVCVTGFFWVKAPQEFATQTFLMQTNRPLNEFPSLVALIRVAPLNPTFLRMAILPILFAIPLIFVLLNKRYFSRGDCFLSVAMIVSLILCQASYYLPRYYVSIFPFLFLGISWLLPPLDVKLLTARLKAGLLVFLAVLVFSFSLSVVLLRNYTSYLDNWPVFSSNEEQVYEETLDFLEAAGAKKIYAASPSFAAMSGNLDSTLAFDTFALLWLEKKPPKEIVTDLIDEGVDYVVLDAWTRYWSYPYKKEVTELVEEVRLNSRLVKVIEPDSPCSAEIYLLGAEAEGIFNGNFEQWVRTEEMEVPLGWNPTLIKSEGDEAIIREADIAGKKCVALDVYEDGEKYGETDSTHAGISQKISFPQSKITVEVYPRVNTTTTETLALGPCIYFIDRDGHACIIGFSDEVDTETIIRSEDGKRILVFQPAQLNQWSEHTIDLAAYWSHAGWQQPTEVTMLLVVSAYYTNPGYYNLYIARVGMNDVRAGTVR